MLKDYAQFWGTKPEGWSFLTGSPAAIRAVTRRYGVYAAKQKDGSVDHTAAYHADRSRGADTGAIYWAIASIRTSSGATC